MIWFSSDFHFSHFNILEYSKRPFSSVEEMNRAILDNVNSIVQESDTLYHLGDFLMGPQKLDNFKRIFSQIRCKNIVLLKGNHDDWMDKHKTEVIEFLGYFPETYKEIRVGKKLIVMCHYPIASFNEQSKGSFHVSGHCHGTMPINYGIRRMDVGIDTFYSELGMVRPEYKPYSLDQVKAVMDNRTQDKVDHH